MFTQTLALLLGKTISFLTQTIHIGGGSAAPGLYALKIEPEMVKKLTSQIPANIIITGTNGKTTTARLLAHFAHAAGQKVVRNATGSNLERGIASALIQHSNIFGQIQADLGIWELDEAAFNSVALKIKPKIVIFLNVFRDQLDRYGEVDTVVNQWRRTLLKLPENTLFLINGDDVNTVSLVSEIRGKIELFGLQKFKIPGESSNQKSSTKKLDYLALDIQQDGLAGTSFKLAVSDAKAISQQLKTIRLPVPGTYHIYDFLAALAAGWNLNFDPNAMIQSLKNFSPAFGRVEKIQLGKNEAFIFLIKNPTGAGQVFGTINHNLKGSDRLLIILNDNFADGKDISWIWDAPFEGLKGTGSIKFICSGTRAQDLAVRLKYAGIDVDDITIENDLGQALKQAQENLTGKLFILPTYTALLQLQKHLTNSGMKKKYYWKD